MGMIYGDRFLSQKYLVTELLECVDNRTKTNVDSSVKSKPM